MSEVISELKQQKTKQDYSRNVKKLKIKINSIEIQINSLQNRINYLKNTSNDKIIALKISKFCKERKFTPEILFRFTDRESKGNIIAIDLFKTFAELGLILSNHQKIRLEYLLDENISGTISYSEYNSYLQAFKIKKQYSNNNNSILNNTLNKLDINVIDRLIKQNKQHNKQLLNYEQFIKYCHEYFPNLSNKQLAYIFNHLSKNQLIDLQQFLNYLKIKQQDDKKKKLKKNKQNQSVISDSIQSCNTLKSIITLILKYKICLMNDIFHCSEFLRLERILKRAKGSLVILFREIDLNKNGSFNWNDLIKYYIKKQKQFKLLQYVYELMGIKIINISNQQPQNIIKRYNNNNMKNIITIIQFKKFIQMQFNLKQNQILKILNLIQRNNNNSNQIDINKILLLMNLKKNHKQKLIYIKPSFWKTQPKQFLKKGYSTLITNGLIALRFCLLIQNQLLKRKPQNRLWDDYQFGPILEDQEGLDSIGMNLTSEQINWVRTEELGMTQFHFKHHSNDLSYQASTQCPHQIFLKALCGIVDSDQNCLWWRGQINYTINKVQQQHLNPLFLGIHPLIFHHFRRYGIYVFRFFVHEKWVYVLIDNKIPCYEKKIIFSSAKQHGTSWISLIEKAYAKIKGNYYKMYDVADLIQYIYQITRLMGVYHKLPPIICEQNLLKDSIWTNILLNQNPNSLLYLQTDYSNSSILSNNKMFPYKYPIQIHSSIELQDENCINQHKSHRLILLNNPINKQQIEWNEKWNRIKQNKYNTFSNKIKLKLKQRKKQILLNSNNNILINYKSIRQIFNFILKLIKVNFDEMIILRKILEFQENFKCKYEIYSELEIQIIFSLNCINSPKDTILIISIIDHLGSIINQYSFTTNFIVYHLKLSKQIYYIEISVKNWHKEQLHIYSLTFYMQNPKYSLKQRDRHMLFTYLSPYNQHQQLNINQTTEKQRTFIYQNFYKNAQKKTIGCC